jgi:hypothetical protein
MSRVVKLKDYLKNIIASMKLTKSKSKKELFFENWENLMKSKSKETVGKQRFNDLERVACSVAFIETMRARIEYSNSRLRPSLDDGMEPYEERSSNVTKNILIGYMLDADFERFSFFLIRKMDEYKFATQPSVNLILKNDGRAIHIDKGNISYELFAEVNLLEHTNNVVREFGEFIRETNIFIHKDDIRLIGLGCLLHDFGKCKEIVDDYGFDSSGFNKGEYKHEVYSRALTLEFAKEFDYGLILHNTVYAAQIDRLLNIIGNHHCSESSIQKVDPLVKYVKMIDRRAREKEYALIIAKMQKKT